MIRPPNAIGGEGTMETERAGTMPVIKSKATYEDLVAVPDNLVAEIVDGNLHTNPRPAMQHALAATALGYVLGNPFHDGIGGPGGWLILDEPELHLGDDVVVPDIAGWRRERMADVPEAPWTSLAPDWICEVASPATERLDRVEKLRIYAREGVTHAWLVNPLSKMLEVFRRDGQDWTRVAAHGNAGPVRLEPFKAIAWELGRLWARSK
jgi:Uma2 family endonuclease